MIIIKTANFINLSQTENDQPGFVNRDQPGLGSNIFGVSSEGSSDKAIQKKWKKKHKKPTCPDGSNVTNVLQKGMTVCNYPKSVQMPL